MQGLYALFTSCGCVCRWLGTINYFCLLVRNSRCDISPSLVEHLFLLRFMLSKHTVINQQFKRSLNLVSFFVLHLYHGCAAAAVNKPICVTYNDQRSFSSSNCIRSLGRYLCITQVRQNFDTTFKQICTDRQELIFM